MTIHVRKYYGADADYNTYTVYVDREHVGYVRLEKGNPRGRWQHTISNAPEFFAGADYRRWNAVNRLLAAAGRDERITPRSGRYSPDPAPTPTPDSKSGGTKTTILNSCGHYFDYNIKRPSAIEWLKKQPCPPCRKAGVPSGSPLPQPSMPGEIPEPKSAPPEPTPAPEPKKAEKEVDKEWVEAALGKLPKGIFHSILPEVTLLVQAGIPVWLQGPMGTTKSTLAQQVAEGLGLDFYPMRCHELMSESQLFGFVDAQGNEHRTPLWDAYEKGGVLLIDESDNGNANLLAALNGALSNGQCVFAGSKVVDEHPNFRIIATANTAGLGPEHGFIGRNGVDLATRDRFVTVQCPIDSALEDALGLLYLGESTLEELSSAFTDRAEKQLSGRSRARQDDLRAGDITKAVRKLRQLVESRFRGMVVSPRTTIHAATMLRAGFTLHEALSTKLPGLKQTEIEDLLAQVL